MSDQPDQIDPAELKKEVAYYKRQLDELAGINLKADYEISGLRHELKQKRQAFALLSELQRSVGLQNSTSAIFEVAMQAVGSTLGMDRTVILIKTQNEGEYKSSVWMGYSAELAESLPDLTFQIPESLALGSESLLVHGKIETTPLIAQLKESLHLPYFVLQGVSVDGQNIGILISGRVLEKKPLYPPLDAGDADTFRSIAGLISAVVRNMRVAHLEEADRLKTQFFANISHEFRTPITLTIGPIESILKGRFGEVSDSVKTQIEGLLRNQVRLLTLVNQILDLSKLESGAMNLNAEKMTDMNGFIHDRAEQFKIWAEKRGFELKINLDPKVPDADVFIDKEKFDRVLLNLLSNSCKFTKHGYVEVATQLKEKEFLLSVKDTGMGIKADQLPTIFDRFKQADGSASREHAGTGLGLSLVKELVELHGGSITVSSEYGKGTTFLIHLPLGKEHLAATSIIEATHSDAASLANVKLQVVDVREGRATDEEMQAVNERNLAVLAALKPGKSTLLFTDDNRDMREHVYSILSEDYNVLLAVHGKHGLEVALEHHVDLILSDLMMPVMTGLEFCKQARATLELSAVPFLLLTAKTDFDSKMAGLDQGADDYLSKPFSEVELLTRIRNLLRIRSQHLRLQQELRAARDIQRALLPPRELHFNKLELTALYVPSEELSGDFYDVIRSGDWLYSYVADVTSHGTAAAQITYLIKGLFQEALSKESTPELPELMMKIGEKYRQYQVNYGVGIQISRLNLQTRKFEYVMSNAPKALLIKGGVGSFLRVRPGPLIDSDESSIASDYPVCQIDLEADDVLYLFTDGCYEFEKASSTGSYGIKELKRAIESLPAETWDTQLIETLREANGGIIFEDDLTMVRFRFPE